MESTLVLAKYIFDRVPGCTESQLQKLVYMAERESLIRTKKGIIQEDFYAWKDGPGVRSIRQEFSLPYPFINITNEPPANTKQYADIVLEKYSDYSEERLMQLFYKDFGWRIARSGIPKDQDGNIIMSEYTMVLDATAEHMRRNYI